MAANVPRSFRLPPPLDRRLTAAMEAQGTDRTELVVQLLERALPAEGTPMGQHVHMHVSKDRVNLAALASTQTGLPESVCRAKIRGGALTVGGERFIDDLARPERVDGRSIVFDGRPLQVG
jgi:hypothetical protein